MTSSDSHDVVNQITGGFGKWQLRSLIFIFLCKIPATWFMACISFTAPVPQVAEYFCIPDGQDDRNATSQWRKTFPLRELEEKTDREFYIDQCYYPYRRLDSTDPLNNSTSPELKACQQFEHNAEYESLVTQFDLVCSREMLVSLTQAFHALGGLIGGLLALHILKYVSPKRLMFYGMIGQIICGNLTGVVSTFVLHVYYRCLTSVFCAFMTASGQVIVTDITSGKARTLIIVLSEVFASIGLILLPCVAMYCDSWTSLYFAISSSLVLFLIPHRFITESPRWLLKHGQIDETLGVLKQSAQVNGRVIPMDVVPRLEQMSWELLNMKSPSYWTIWDGKTPRRFIVMLHWVWPVSVVIYTVMILMIRLLGVTHMHVNTFSLGFAEILGILLGLYIILYTKRHWLHAGVLMIFAGFTTYLIWLSPNTVKASRKAGYELLFWLILKMINSANLVVLTTCTGEMVAPQKRPMLMLSTGTFARFWLTIVPFTLVVGKIHYLLPMTMFATAAVSSGAMICYFNRHFPRAALEMKVTQQSIITAANMYRKRSSSLLSQEYSSNI